MLDKSENSVYYKAIKKNKFKESEGTNHQKLNLKIK